MERLDIYTDVHNEDIADWRLRLTVTWKDSADLTVAFVSVPRVRFVQAKIWSS